MSERDVPQGGVESAEMTITIEKTGDDAEPQLGRDRITPAGQDPTVDKDVRYSNTLYPIPVPPEYGDINFRPFMLEYKVLIAILTFNILCVCSILATLYCANHNYQYHTRYNNIYIVVRYVPTVVGTISTLLFRSQRDTFSRIQPYISMADQGHIRQIPGSKCVGQSYMRGIPIFNRYFWAKGSRHTLRATLWISNILVVQIAGYKAALFSTAHSNEGWLVTVHYQMAWLLISLYLLIIFSCAWMVWKMWRAKTGLKWDPVRILDVLALFHGSNVLGDFEELEKWPDELAFELLRNKKYRIGYWEKGINKEIWYGIGRTDLGLGSAASRLNRNSEGSLAECRESKHRPYCSHASIHSYNSSRYPWYRASYAPWTVFVWAPFVCCALGLFIYTVSSGIIHRGFSIPTHTPFTNSSSASQFTYNLTSPGGDLIIANFDPGNGLLWALFCTRTILVILASYMAISWFGVVDRTFRFSQPFKNMHTKPATAEDSILLDYVWGLPGLTTINALKKKHWLVAWFSFLTFFSPTFPILVGGIFVITNTGQRIYFSITPATFYLVAAYLVIYAISVPLAWPRLDRRLMRFHNSIADYASLFYASYLLHDPDSKLDISARNVTQRHLESRVFLEEKTYSVGLYRGVDAKCHFGLDVATLDMGAGEEKHVFSVPYESRRKRKQLRNRNQEDEV